MVEEQTTDWTAQYKNSHWGLTKREYFAGQAIISAAYLWRGSSPKEAAECAVELADALLAELAK